jgi:hypothetical protein
MDPISTQADILDRSLMGDSSIQNPAAINSSVDSNSVPYVIRLSLTETCPLFIA